MSGEKITGTAARARMARQIEGGNSRGLSHLDGILRSKFSYAQEGGGAVFARPGGTQRPDFINEEIDGGQPQP